jgi:glutamate racemase
MLQYDQWRIDKNWKEISQFLMENEKAKIEAAKQRGCFQTGRAFMWTHERFVKKRIDQILHLDPQIDCLILGCTHYPLLMPKILKYLPTGIRVVPQGEYVADSLQRYFENHADMEQLCSKGGNAHYMTTENPDKFKEQAQMFLHEPVEVENITLG